MPSVQNILFPYDFSTAAQRVVAFVRDVAVRTGGHVTVLAVTEPGERKADLAVQLGAVLHEELHGVPVSRIAESGDPATRIAECARRLGSQLIMMPKNGQGASRSLPIGSVTAKVLYEAPCPVWTARVDNEVHPGDGVILCIKDEREDLNACSWAREFGESIGASITTVQAREMNADTSGASTIVVARGPLVDRPARLRSYVLGIVIQARCPVISV